MKISSLGLRASLTAAAIVASASAGWVLVAGPATADVDPVTGGTTTISIPLAAEFGDDASGIYALPTTPASLAYDPVAKVVNYSYPVTGGDASVNTFFGTLKHAGGLLVGRADSRRTVLLSDLVFNIEDDTVSATVPALVKSAAPTKVVFFDALGNHELAAGTPETFTASDLELDPAGAKYLDTALHTRLFKAFAHVGSFATSFTNSND